MSECQRAPRNSTHDYEAVSRSPFDRSSYSSSSRTAESAPGLIRLGAEGSDDLKQPFAFSVRTRTIKLIDALKARYGSRGNVIPSLCCSSV